MDIIPAIDIIDGKCVRLTKGDYNICKTYSDNPLDMALQFQDAGIRRLHLVDLDGARSKHIVNYPTLESIATHTDLTIDFAHREMADFIIKGVRSAKDFEYEREQADINKQIGNIDTLLLFAEPMLASVSSSMVRELIHFGKDIREFLP